MNIEEMYGSCDGRNILFQHIGGNEWQCIVPADFDDGTYVVEIYAKTKTGSIVYYTAVLYMSNGKVVSLQAQKDDVIVIIRDNRTYANPVKRINVSNMIEEQFAEIIDHILVKAKVSYEL